MNYFQAIISHPSVIKLQSLGYIKISIEDQTIEFVTNKSDITSKALYIEEHDEGALVVTVDEQDYVFYIPGYGSLKALDKTANFMDIVANALNLSGSNHQLFISNFGSSKKILIDTGKEKIYSTSAYSKNVVANIKSTVSSIFGAGNITKIT